MKKILIIILLISCAFGSTIYAQIFPEDIYGKAHFFVFIIEVIMMIFSLLSFFIIERFLTKNNLKILVSILIGVICLYINLNILPTEYGPKQFLIHSSNILCNYEKLTMNDFKDSHKTKDVIINNVILEKFSLNTNLYHIKYLDISDPTVFPQTIKEFPIWIKTDKVIYDNNSLTTSLHNNVFTFRDYHKADSIKFRIATDGLNKVESFYSGGGTDLDNNIRKSGVIDQKGVRIIVSKVHPELTIDNSYGKIMRLLTILTK